MQLIKLLHQINNLICLIVNISSKSIFPSQVVTSLITPNYSIELVLSQNEKRLLLNTSVPVIQAHLSVYWLLFHKNLSEYKEQ